jgi:hypothetical protein
MYQNRVTSRPRSVERIISSIVALPPLHVIAGDGKPVGSPVLLLGPVAVVDEVFQNAVLDPDLAAVGQALAVERAVKRRGSAGSESRW